MLYFSHTFFENLCSILDGTILGTNLVAGPNLNLFLFDILKNISDGRFNLGSYLGIVLSSLTFELKDHLFLLHPRVKNIHTLEISRGVLKPARIVVFFVNLSNFLKDFVSLFNCKVYRAF